MPQLTAHVGDHPPPGHRLSAEAVDVVIERRAVVVGEDLQRDAEILAVAEDGPVVMGDPGGAEIGVEMLPVGEGDPLAAVDLLNDIAGAHRQVAAARAIRRLEDRPSTYFGLARAATASKLTAGRWWHSSTTRWP